MSDSSTGPISTNAASLQKSYLTIPIAVPSVLLAFCVSCGNDLPKDVPPVLAQADPASVRMIDSTEMRLPIRSDTGALEVPQALPGLGLAPSSEERKGAPEPRSAGAPPAAGPEVARATMLDGDKWTELTALDPSFVLDLRYATTNNFVGAQMYDCGRCYLRNPAAQSLKRIQDSLRTLGLGFKLYDCYRPLSVQWKLWNEVPDRRYVADPRRGSQHNRGVAVDLTLVDLATGRELDMGTAYDFFGKEAWHASTAGYPQPVRGNRERLLALMEGHNWRRTSSEWWHYSYRLPKSATPIEEDEWSCD